MAALFRWLPPPSDGKRGWGRERLAAPPRNRLTGPLGGPVVLCLQVTYLLFLDVNEFLVDVAEGLDFTFGFAA
jgi:hypothetical protein